MEIAGTVGAAVGLACAIGSVSKALADCIHTMRLADRDAHLTHMELATLDHFLLQFDQLVSSHDSEGARLNKQTGIQKLVISQGRFLIREMKRILKEIGMLDTESLKTGRQRWFIRFRWYIRKKEVLELCVRFNQVKVSIMAFVSMVGLKSMRSELEKVREELEKLHRDQVPESTQRIEQLQQISQNLEYRVKAFAAQVEAARRSCKKAAREVREQNLLPEARELSRELDRSVRAVSKIVIDKQFDDNSGKRHRHSTSRHSSRRPPSSDGRPTRRSPTAPTSPSSGSTMVTIPSPSPVPTAVYHPDQPLEQEEDATKSSGEAIVSPLTTRGPRYFRDFRNEPFPDRHPTAREYPEDISGNEARQSAESQTEPSYGQGTYVNPGNPQHRRRRLPNGRLSEG